ncbi:putative deacylase [Clostridium pasteurianum DSM 525 = ATCC 6013]|uniref:Putative deacylase n=1 Tax=Clostridium pasteurianum DSM 525 = ATCC 6013 TaxID=1262449 RepID=A0A0H3J9R3_CLOPA|nr:M14 family metallopeptidase [Clostridium pasteurianum]AJA47915.1 putative deacylase [Clostridium pasteurianum DSM 525 = ATCC 6013]AJA51903.1 putative deacylase [Clostridium pasteurianum DSM 525 = ATCC 6013]AOZ75203.1 succinylglutamate desuccinylase [Clostridium pasteurianum DSM 525 = ATCC 6013]AOZ78998.1 succinylglutamate desuccinylase [Clostridium pasteurianum]ELP59818.1 succinylglutamate desuccinylase [Clostridium pasteurianum DSM 525 = ATCC 6013]
MGKQVETVFTRKLPVDEILEIKRCRYIPDNINENDIERLPRICIVTGTHGDELEGQYICYELSKKLQEDPKHIQGIIDIYPALNPLGIDSISRGIPNFDLDMNRIFPGKSDGSTITRIAHNIVESLKGADIVIDIHASNIFLREIPQARINENMADRLLPIANLLNLDFLWVHPAATVLESTLCHSLNIIDTPCIVVEMGVGMRITKDYGNQLLKGIFNVMKKLKIWSGETKNADSYRKAINSMEHEVFFLNSSASGIFVPSIDHCTTVKKGDKIGNILDPLEGKIKEKLISPCNGMVFTLREYPIVYTGSLVARLIGEEIISNEKGNNI